MFESIGEKLFVLKCCTIFLCRKGCQKCPTHGVCYNVLFIELIIPQLVKRPTPFYRTSLLKISSLDPGLSPMNPVHVFKPFSLQINFSIILLCPVLSNFLFSLNLRNFYLFFISLKLGFYNYIYNNLLMSEENIRYRN